MLFTNEIALIKANEGVKNPDWNLSWLQVPEPTYTA